MQYNQEVNMKKENLEKYLILFYYLYLLIKYIKKVKFKNKRVNNLGKNCYNDLLKEKGISELFYVLNGILIRPNNSHNHYNSIVGEMRKKYGGYELTTEVIKIYKELKKLKNYMLKNENKYLYKYKLIF
mgnify:CR=1 FL=1